ncbi:interleukin-10 receptor subunit beta isoform X3 [Poecile atricapillus]|uniref:interleukin-10 receptor subunit beta isoform X3 n=1 Tax=Poecile atricapillus TaxID=48891 RepID=UPI00273845ED|nr:interleukin-10 receptor subunit beta isoform X3 [Poecile atricapillus]
MHQGSLKGTSPTLSDPRAIVGPPEVRLKSESGDLHVDFSGPFAGHGQDRWPLRHYYGSWNYRIFYWKKGSTDTDPASASRVAQVDTKHNSEILSQLEPWTVYCVQVQAVIPEWNKTGELSRELCEQTTHNGVTPVWVTVTVLVGSMLVVATAVTACFFSSFYLYRLIKHVFCPSYVFPEHLKESNPKASVKGVGMRPAGHQSTLRTLHKEPPTQEWEQPQQKPKYPQGKPKYPQEKPKYPQEKPKYPPHSSFEKKKQMDFWVYLIAEFSSRKKPTDKHVTTDF